MKHIPNALSVFRILDVAVVIVLMEYNCEIGAFIFFMLGMFSDMLDGYVARRVNVVTDVGKLLDPLADKIFVSGILIAMIKTMGIPYWMVIVIVAREFAVTGLRSIAALRGIAVSASFWGKVKAGMQFCAIGVLLLGYMEIGICVLFAAVVFTVFSGALYFVDYWRKIV